ncbi:hypothetical protein AMATHDRAFT_136904 [Amanita thiersii Skay4041]|uniref:Uncharacterized protein n=1 Tax=Amanita thiersii Skay4041 TaxID=703135 RepID=A0A2A9NRR3_9AGAR|nr:hypothetical protein AMATHDRAFT_136904 [Amanita thiersii Skay4041]
MKVDYACVLHFDVITDIDLQQQLTFLATVLYFTTCVFASGVPLTQEQAEAELIPNGITASSSGNCTDRDDPTCTSYEGILSGTVDGVIAFKQASGASSLVITGGTEVGHADGTFSHANGFKVDLRHATIIDDFIHNSFVRIADRSDGFPQWQASTGDIYCDEGTHWDVTYF